MADDYQSEFPESLRKFLMDPKAYPDRTESVSQIETHASVLFLTDRFVYKFKKNVNFGFLDFSSPEKRKEFLDRELLLNRRLCGGVYLEIVSVKETADEAHRRFSFSGDGHTAAHCLKMNRMKDCFFFKDLLSSGQINEKSLREITGILRQFYKNAHSGDEIRENGRAENVKRNTDGNFEHLEKFAGKAFSPEVYSALKEYTETFYRKYKYIFDERIRKGMIRDCHGDLHLEHLHFHDGTWCIFDCIEFNDRFRWIDVLSDIAFLMMDLEYRGRKDLASFIEKEFSDFMDGPEEKELLNFYRVYRALVRAKVECLTAEHTGDSRHFQAAAQYMKLALNFILTENKPAVIVFFGRVASGKSNLAKRFAEETGAVHYACDSVRKRLAGLPEYERPDQSMRGKIYTEEFSDKTYSEAFRLAMKDAAEGRTAAVDCTFSRKKYREEARKLFGDLPHFFMIQAFVPEEIMIERLKKRDLKKNVISDARIEDFSRIDAGFEPPGDGEKNILKVSTEADKSESFRSALVSIALARMAESVRKQKSEIGRAHV